MFHIYFEKILFSILIYSLIELELSMRFSITVRKADKEPVSFNYQYGLASMFYHKMGLSDKELATKTHEDTGYKFYTFSNLKLHDRIKCENGLNYSEASLILSSPNEEFIRRFTEGLLMDPEFFLEGIGNKKICHTIEEIKLLPSVSFSNQAIFQTVSPVYAKTMRLNDGIPKEYDLSPEDPKFFENIHKNIIDKYAEYYGRALESDFFEIYDIRNIKPKRIRIADTFRRCSLFSFSVQAPSQLIKFMYDSGIGEKNAMGFGCLNPVVE